MSYTNVFGGNTIYPSDVSYLSISLSVDTPLEWPLESSGTEAPAARIIDVGPSADGFSIILPDATLTGAGQTILFNNIDSTNSFFVKDHGGHTLATVAAGTQWQVYLAATTTANGTWRVFRYGASTATVQPSALAGQGLTTIGSQLAQSLPVRTFTTSPVTVSNTANRAEALVWIGTGAGAFNLPTAASAGNNFFIFVRNSGAGDLTIEPAGSETINGAPNLALRPGDSATAITDGLSWYTIGLGQEAVFAFDYTVINLSGRSGNYPLSGSELNRIAYRFTSDPSPLAGDVYIIVPSTIQQYWITNATSGSFRLFIKTSTGTPTQVNQGAKGIYYCNGTNMVLASDPTSLTTPIVVSDGGTGGTTPSSARSGIGISTFGDGLVTAADADAARGLLFAAKSGANNDITSLTGLTTPMSVAQGGTGVATLTGLVKGTGTTAFAVAVAGTDYLAPGGAGSFTTLSASGAVSGTGFSNYLASPPAIGGTAAAAITGTTITGTTITANTGFVGAINGTVGASTPNTGAFTTLSATISTASPLINGGTAVGSNLTLQSTSAAGTTDYIAFKTGTQVEQLRILNTGGITSADLPDAVGYKGLPFNNKSGDYTLAASDMGKYIFSSNTGAQAITIPTGTGIPVGAAVTLVNNGTTAITFVLTGITFYKAGTSATYSGTLGVRGMATLLKVAADTWYISGAGLS